MNFKCTEEELQIQQTEYKKNYPAWKPFDPSYATQHIAKQFSNLVTTQNGQDTDDYLMNEHHKVYRYIRDVPVGSSILFLGTGTGREVCAAKELGYDANGLTLGNRNTYFGRTYLGLIEDELQEGLNECIPWEKESFDFIHGYQVFEHTIAPLIFLLEIGRVLKYGGQVLLEWPPGKDYTGDDNPHHQICYTPGQAIALMKKAGFSSVVCVKDNGDPIPEDYVWRNDQDYMLVVRGTKEVSHKDYVRRAWNII